MVGVVTIDISAHNANYDFQYTARNIAETSNIATATVILDAIPDVSELINDYPLTLKIPDGCVTNDIIEVILDFIEKEDSETNTLAYTSSIAGSYSGTLTTNITNDYDIRVQTFNNVGSTGVTLNINIDNGLTQTDRAIGLYFDDMSSSNAYQQATLYMIDVIFDNVSREILLPFNTLLDNSATEYQNLKYIYPAGVIRLVHIDNQYGTDVTATIVNNRLNVQIANGVSLDPNDYLGVDLANCNGDTWYVPVKIMEAIG